MPPLNDVTLTAKDGNLGRRAPSDDMISGLITTGVASGDLVLGESNQLKSVDDLEALGIDATYDSGNNILVYHHVKEFFRMNPSGTLWLMVVGQTVTMKDIADVANPSYLLKLLKDAKGKIRQFGIGRNPVVGYTPTTTGGMDTDVFGAIPKAQQLCDAEWTAHRPVCGLIEGRSFTGSATAATDLRTLDSKNIAVTILQDKEVASGHAILNGYAGIGTSLGLLSRARVNVSVMYVEAFDLQSVADGMYLSDDTNDNLNLSSNLAVSSYSDTDLGTLKDKGYWFGLTYQDYEGVHFADSATCTAITSDFAYIENVRTMNKAARKLYPVYVAKLGAPVDVDEDSGQIETTQVKYFEGIGYDTLTEMLTDKEVSGRDVEIDPTQDIISTSKLKVKFSITPTGTARNIEGELAFNNPFKS